MIAPVRINAMTEKKLATIENMLRVCYRLDHGKHGMANLHQSVLIQFYSFFYSVKPFLKKHKFISCILAQKVFIILF
jgi:hypothetical protein